MKITTPGIFYDVAAADYFADPCPQPSLTQSIAKILLSRSPLHAWHAHPRLNPDYKPDDDTKFDIGNVAHRLLIGRGKDIVTLEYNDWRTKAAQEAREKATSEGKCAVLGHQHARAQNMVTAALEQLKLRGLEDWFREGAGHGEVVLACRDGVWLRQMVDWIEARTIIDLKTTGIKLWEPLEDCLGQMIAGNGWDIQAAMAEHILQILGLERHRFLFVIQESEKPYCLAVTELSETDLTMGRKQLAAARMIWRDCMKADRWPGFRSEIIRPSYPGWLEARWLNREQTEFSQPNEDLIMAG